MLSEAAAIADSITSSSVYATWSQVETDSPSQTIAELRTCPEEALDRRRIVKDMSEQWCALGAVRPSSCESTSPYGVPISTIVKEGQVDYVPVGAPSGNVPGPSRVRSSPGKKRKKLSRSRSKLPCQIEIASPTISPQKQPLFEDPNFASTMTPQASRGKSRRSGRHRRTAPVFRRALP